MGNLTNCSKNNEFDTSEFTYANYNILFVGVSGVGKSSLIDQLTQSKFSLNTAPTTAFQYVPYICTIPNQQKVKLTLIDAPGLKQSLQCLTPSLLQKIDAVVYCYSVTCQKSLKEMLKFKRNINNIMDQSDINRKPLVYVIGNKTDQIKNPVIPQVMDLVQPYRHFFTSCQFGFNLPKMFQQVGQDIFDSQHSLNFDKQDPLNFKQIYSHIKESTNNCF